MEKLPNYHKTNIYEYNLIVRVNNVALYDYSVRGLKQGYCVFIVKSQKETFAKFKDTVVHLKAKELFPSDNSYGKTAWYFKNLTEAEKKFDELMVNTLLIGHVEKQSNAEVEDELELIES